MLAWKTVLFGAELYVFEHVIDKRSRMLQLFVEVSPKNLFFRAEFYQSFVW